MELKKGDAIAVIAEVVGEQRDRIWVSIQGATGSDVPLMVPKHKVRLLERLAEVGDTVTHKKKGEFLFHRREGDSLALLLRKDASPGDPEGYVMAQMRDIRRADQSGAVKFAPIEKQIPNAESFQDMEDERQADAIQHDASAEAPGDAEVRDSRYDFEEDEAQQDAAAESRSEIDADDSQSVNEVDGDAQLTDEAELIHGADDGVVEPAAVESEGGQEDIAEHVAPAFLLVEGDVQDHDAVDAPIVDADDAITIEMPDGIQPAGEERESDPVSRMIAAIRGDEGPKVDHSAEQVEDESAATIAEEDGDREEAVAVEASQVDAPAVEAPAEPIDPAKAARVENRRDETLAAIRAQQTEDPFDRFDSLSRKSKDA